jgi:hypothetical protein
MLIVVFSQSGAKSGSRVDQPGAACQRRGGPEFGLLVNAGRGGGIIIGRRLSFLANLRTCGADAVIIMACFFVWLMTFPA